MDEMKKGDREHIADREKHETMLTGILDTLRVGGYFREGEQTTLAFPEPGKIGSPWKKRDGSWREGFGKAVARCDTTELMRPPVDAERDARYPTGDHLYNALVSAGYRVDVWPGDPSGSSEMLSAEYYLYEPAGV